MVHIIDVKVSFAFVFCPGCSTNGAKARWVFGLCEDFGRKKQESAPFVES
ncbi:hypothetical protein T458_03990 [Brevibacillus panacihumi W25]|uniref:Uncharacterized protein n=1 Tax=Brevibacillus panacihumi W25 TaxID=1408254 RepID=V6MFR7_9BACL|nr:hypothetical protein T458_03990 [Brevibacillus panacihumi W25]